MDGAPLSGDFGALASTVRTLVSRLRTVSAGVSRLVREVGTEGKLGTQASTEGLSGTWKELVGDVNLLGTNPTAQVRNASEAFSALREHPDVALMIVRHLRR
jgi:hypothetical protein